MTTVVERRLEFDAGHRVYGHESKCANLHGHRYVVLVQATAPALDNLGRVVDFSVLKEKLGAWLDTHWDHTCVVFEDDKLLRQALDLVPKTKPLFIAPFNPTAENMAEYLLNVVCPELFSDTLVSIIGITIFETPNCSATAVLS